MPKRSKKDKKDKKEKVPTLESFLITPLCGAESLVKLSSNIFAEGLFIFLLEQGMQQD